MSDKPSDKSCFKLQQQFIKCLDGLDKDIALHDCKNILQTYLIKCAGKISKEWNLAILATH
jgi:hypothetical protein